MYDATFKIILFGDPGSEKTQLTQRFLTNLYLSDPTMTIGVDFEVKSLTVDGQKVKLQIWDFGGEERFRFLLPTYVRGARGGLFLYDITDYSSIAHIDDWLSVVRKEIRAEDTFPIIVVGTKAHLVDQREVSSADGIKIAKSRNVSGFIEVSAKTGENVAEAFEALTRLMLINFNGSIPRKIESVLKELINPNLPEPDFIFKVICFGDNTSEKQAFLRMCRFDFAKYDSKLTLGVNLYAKDTIIDDKKARIIVWDPSVEKRFKFFLPYYSKGAHAAFFIYNVTNQLSFAHLPERIQVIREQIGDIPIMLIGLKPSLKEKVRVISREQGVSLAKLYRFSAFAEIFPQNEQNINEIFQTLTRILLRRYIDQIQSNISHKPFIAANTEEFIVNRYLKLRLENDQTNIYVGDILFRQCKYLMLNLPITKIRDCDFIESIDEAVERLNPSMEGEGIYKYNLSPEGEFWAHCSNIQMWFEHEYATHLLHRNLAFPLLKALVDVGDPLAKKVFKNEIARRFETGYPSVVTYLLTQGYLEYLNDVELDSVLKSPKFLKSFSKWLFNIRIPHWLYKRLFEKLLDLNCPYCGISFKKSLVEGKISKNSIKCKYCYTSLIRFEIGPTEVKKSVQKYINKKSKTNKRITRATTIKAIKKSLDLAEDDTRWDKDIWNFAINLSKPICKRTTLNTIYFR